jgi:hypothetical protein
VSYRYFSIGSLCLVLALSALAQQRDCATLDVPIGVITATGDAAEGLTTADFAAQSKKEAVAIQSTTYDSGPRRILLVLDADRRFTAEPRKAEIEFAMGVVSSAQPGDSLALIVARGAAHEVKFGADRAALLEALRNSTEQQKDTGKELGVLDAVAEGITWFGEPRLGDAIVVIAKDLEGNHKTNLKAVTKMLEEHHIRLFGAAFGPLLLANTTTGTQRLDREGFGYRDPGMPLYDTDADANFFPMTVNSGGYIIKGYLMPNHEQFKLTDFKKKELEKTASVMSGLIDKLYALRIQGPVLSRSESWTVSVNQSKLPGAHVLYPHELGTCHSSAAQK